MSEPVIPAPGRDLRASLDHARRQAGDMRLPLDQRRQWADQVAEIEAYLVAPQTESLFGDLP